MATQRAQQLPRPPRGRPSSSAVETRAVRQVGARIFADLLPQTTRGRASVPAAPPSISRLEDAQWVRSHADPLTGEYAGSVLRTPALPTGKETPTMRAYRTESRYYFSSRHLLPTGSLVFFSTKLRRYVHPTEGILLDPHPRLQELSDAESQELEVHWQTALARY